MISPESCATVNLRRDVAGSAVNVVHRDRREDYSAI
jgi:hypothetical protein